MRKTLSKFSCRTACRPRVLRLEDRAVPSVVPVGGEFRVNTYTTNSQAVPSVAVDQDGDSVVVWMSNEQDGGNYGIFAQRYNSVGLPQSTEFRVNTYMTNNQYLPSVAMNQAGNFVIAWESYGQDGSDRGIYAQRYDAAGVPQGGEFQVNTYTTNTQQRPSVAMDQAGDFAIAWMSNEQDGSGSGVYAQRYDSAGLPQGGEFRVNTYTTNSQAFPAVALDQAGDFAIAWMSNEQDGSGSGVYAQRYNSAGLPQGGEFRVNTYTTNSQAFPSVAMDQAGDFLVAWNGIEQDGDEANGIYAQRYNAAGLPQSGEFHVNAYSTADQIYPQVAMDQAGDFVIAWTDINFGSDAKSHDGGGYGIYAQAYLATGAPDGVEFRVNTTTTDWQRNPSVAMDQVGDFVVVWDSHGQDGSGDGVYAQRYKHSAPPRVTTTLINNGTAQRSRVFNLTVTFNQFVTLGGGTPTNAFSLTGPNGSIAFTVDLSSSTPTQTIAKLTVNGPGTEFGSLADGNYTLTVVANQVVDSSGQVLDGDNNGTPGGNYIFNFHRLFGDADGNGTVSAADFNAFRLAYGTGPSIFDFNNDGQTNAADFNQFRTRYGVTLVP